MEGTSCFMAAQWRRMTWSNPSIVPSFSISRASSSPPNDDFLKPHISNSNPNSNSWNITSTFKHCIHFIARPRNPCLTKTMAMTTLPAEFGEVEAVELFPNILKLVSYIAGLDSRSDVHQPIDLLILDYRMNKTNAAQTDGVPHKT